MHPLLQEKTSRLMEQTNQAGIDFIVTDLNTGLTFLEIANVSGSDSNRKRNFEKAHEVYRTVTRLLPRVMPSPAVKQQIEKKLEELKGALEKAGYRLQ
jgi:hypothetical protein